VALVELAGARTFLVVPMLKESKLVGAIAIYRQEVRPFTGKQIELVKSLYNAPTASPRSRPKLRTTTSTNRLRYQPRELG
jgi:hypothetical protein